MYLLYMLPAFRFAPNIDLGFPLGCINFNFALNGQRSYLEYTRGKSVNDYIIKCRPRLVYALSDSFCTGTTFLGKIFYSLILVFIPHKRIRRKQFLRNIHLF